MHLLRRFKTFRQSYRHVFRYKATSFKPAGNPFPWNLAKCVGYSTTNRFFYGTSVIHNDCSKSFRPLFSLKVHNAADLTILCDEAVNSSSAIVASVLEQYEKGQLDNKSLLYTIDHISNILCLVADPCELLRHVHPCEEWRNAANATVEKITGFISHINIDEKLYEIMNKAYEASGCLLSAEESLVIHHMIESMRNQGVGLTPSARTSYLDLQREEAIISFELSDCSTLKHLPVAPINGRALPPNTAVYSYILRNSPDENIRRLIWEAQSQSDPTALQKLLHLHNTRSSIARIRGFNNFAECAQRECIMNNPKLVESFLRKCASSVLEDTQSELRELLDVKRSMVPDNTSLHPWDLDHFIGLERDKLGLQLRVSSVLTYFERLLGDLFGVKLVRDASEPLWHPLVAKFALVRSTEKSPPFTNDDTQQLSSTSALNTDASNRVIAHLYMDLFAREGKANVCAQFTVRCSKLLQSHNRKHTIDTVAGVYKGTTPTDGYITTTDLNGSKRQVPATAIVCSFPTSNNHSEIHDALRGTYIDAQSALTLFHELGHTVHALLSRTDLQHLSGNRGGVDFAEFSSHLFELYFLDGLKDICAIEGLDNSWSSKALLSFQKYRAIETGRMILMSLLDLKFYTTSSKLDAGSITQLYNSLDIFRDEFGGEPIARLLGLPALTNFDHLVPYGGTYFCYLYSRVLAIKVWRSFKGKARCRSTGDRLSDFFAKGSTDASIKPLNILAGCDLESMEDELFFH
ncbi:peptidase family M3 containing protein [Babesia ovis]|uniref:Peptidase family M3 containing protein n=1 Tax=Babesia ovis TaxID=5869 RepID=A0A9W5T7T2_BABOV|nr:peptidase family M3 containing protein [Babesia ovis]